MAEEMEQKLAEGLETLVERMYELQEECYDILKKVYPEKKDIRFPVDIKRIADHLKVKVCRAPLNYGGEKRIDQNIAQLCFEIEGGSVINKIILDDAGREGGGADDAGSLSNLERYAIAYELSKLIINQKEYTNIEPIERKVGTINLLSIPYSLPRLAAQLENFEYEMCAIFLLLPLETFLDKFYHYVVEIEEYPVLMDRWIKHLSEKAGLPNYQLVNGYQYIKLCAYQYYVKKLTNIKDDIPEDEKRRLLKYRELFQ